MSEAELLRDLGIARSSQSAERLYCDWGERAYLVLGYFCHTCRIDFTAEDVRDWYDANKHKNPWTEFFLAEPPDLRAWGGVMRRAALEGKIIKVGYQAHRDPKRHKGISTVWRAR